MEAERMVHMSDTYITHSYSILIFSAILWTRWSDFIAYLEDNGNFWGGRVWKSLILFYKDD